jgi:hypothetical protein
MSRVPLGKRFHSPSTCTFNMGTSAAVALIVVLLPLSLAARRQVMRDDSDRNAAQSAPWVPLAKNREALC